MMLSARFCATTVWDALTGSRALHNPTLKCYVLNSLHIFGTPSNNVLRSGSIVFVEGIPHLPQYFQELVVSDRPPRLAGDQSFKRCIVSDIPDEEPSELLHARDEFGATFPLGPVGTDARKELGFWNCLFPAKNFALTVDVIPGSGPNWYASEVGSLVNQIS